VKPLDCRGVVIGVLDEQRRLMSSTARSKTFGRVERDAFGFGEWSNGRKPPLGFNSPAVWKLWVQFKRHPCQLDVVS
jgi:hypothetical protein